MDISARSLHIKREVIGKLLDEGLYPYTKRYLGSFSNHFSTIGLVGMNEVGLNARWLGKDMSDERTQRFTKEVLLHMRERLSDYQEKYEGELFNLEATPAESTAYRLAKHDRKRWPDIKTAGKEGDTPYYTNSSHLPVEYTTDIFDALDIQDDLQTLYTSGTVFHAFIGEKLPDWKAAAALVRKIAENYNCRIIRFRRPILYVRNMATSAESISLVRNVVRRRRFTVVSQDITDLYRTGMTVKHRSIRTVRFMM